MKRKILLFPVLIIILINSCSSGTDPEEKKSLRDYTWTADTLTTDQSVQTLMRSIWASSSNDIYVCGHNNSGIGNIWHYNGHKWSYIDDIIRNDIGRLASLSNVHGTNENNVWLVGYNGVANTDKKNSFIVQYNGQKWVEHKIIYGSAINWVYAASVNDVWACGDDGITYHYNGSVWDIDTINVPVSGEAWFSLYSIVKVNNQVYCAGSRLEQGGFNKKNIFFKRENDNWVEVESYEENQGINWGTRLLVSTYKELYSIGSVGVHKWEGSQWLKVFSSQFPLTWMADIGENDVLITGGFGKIFHYNGADWKQFEQFENIDFIHSAVWRNDEEAFIVTLDLTGTPQTTIIWHGK
ncbi:MAG: hypothetical protein KJ571_03740 [Bacteroidetes bacterium]|nr:hypothetical protein [Bacteroidota bacterium]